MPLKLQPVKLHYTRDGGGPPVVLLHGLFGSGSNLGALARSLRDRFAVYSLDLPNHGRSDWLQDADLSRLARCVGDWMGRHELGGARLVGHSLGGKVAMQLALSQPRLVVALVVADIAPVVYPARHDAVFAALEAVAARQCTSREQAAVLMSEHLQDEDVVQFLLMSLRRDGRGVYDWRFNLAGIRRDYGAVRDAPRADVPYRGPVQFIKGGASDYIRPEHREEILALFPQATVKIMPGCGHWLHAQRPELFNGIVGRFLDRVS